MHLQKSPRLNYYFGSPVWLIPPTRPSSNIIPAVSEFLECINLSSTIAKDNLAIVKTTQTMNINKEQLLEPEYKVGDRVFLNTKNLGHQIKQKRRSAKFIARYIGPFPITRPNKRHLHTPCSYPQSPEYKIHPTFHARLLKPAVDNDPELFPNREVTLPS